MDNADKEFERRLKEMRERFADKSKKSPIDPKNQAAEDAKTVQEFLHHFSELGRCFHEATNGIQHIELHTVNRSISKGSSGPHQYSYTGTYKLGDAQLKISMLDDYSRGWGVEISNAYPVSEHIEPKTYLYEPHSGDRIPFKGKDGQYISLDDVERWITATFFEAEPQIFM